MTAPPAGPDDRRAQLLALQLAALVREQIGTADLVPGTFPLGAALRGWSPGVGAARHHDRRRHRPRGGDRLGPAQRCDEPRPGRRRSAEGRGTPRWRVRPADPRLGQRAAALAGCGTGADRRSATASTSNIWRCDPTSRPAERRWSSNTGSSPARSVGWRSAASSTSPIPMASAGYGSRSASVLTTGKHSQSFTAMCHHAMRSPASSRRWRRPVAPTSPAIHSIAWRPSDSCGGGSSNTRSWWDRCPWSTPNRQSRGAG